jgi:chromosome segregation ATPase
MTNNEYCYNVYKGKYYESCSEISSCENRIYNLNNQRKQKINQINQLKTDITNTQKALDGFASILKNENSLNNKMVAVGNKTGEASANFSSMVTGDTKAKSLIDVYGDETAKTRTALANVLNTLETRKNMLSAKLSDLKNQLKSANADLQDIDNQIRTANSDSAFWQGQKNHSSYYMEYYRKKMIKDAS